MYIYSIFSTKYEYSRRRFLKFISRARSLRRRPGKFSLRGHQQEARSPSKVRVRSGAVPFATRWLGAAAADPVGQIRCRGRRRASYVRVGWIFWRASTIAVVHTFVQTSLPAPACGYGSTGLHRRAAAIGRQMIDPGLAHPQARRTPAWPHAPSARRATVSLT